MKRTVKFAKRKKVPVKSANVTNLKKTLQTHHPQQYAKIFLDVQKVTKMLIFMKVYWTVQNVDY